MIETAIETVITKPFAPFLFIFFEASSPSYPKISFTKGRTFSFHARSLMVLLCLIASIAVMRLALKAGIKDEINMVSAEKKIMASTMTGCVLTGIYPISVVLIP